MILLDQQVINKWPKGYPKYHKYLNMRRKYFILEPSIRLYNKKVLNFFYG